MKPLLVIVPTRGRPANAARLAKAFEDTGSLNAELLFVVDHDDPELSAYQEEIPGFWRMVCTRPSTGTGMVAGLNHAADQYAGSFEYLGFMGDDHVPRTPGWDAHVLGALRAADPGVVYGDDLLQGSRLPTAAFLPSRAVRALGYMAPPQLRHLYVDNFWLELGQALGSLRYLPEVVIEHVHPAAGKAAMDERYAAVNSADVDTADRLAFENFRRTELPAAVQRVRDAYGAEAAL